ncbi:MAG: hypothetical protein J0M02_18355 [Planctomycetes bacterium]|nr:hypothetical protein [Planctomycetota bacterium]
MFCVRCGRTMNREERRCPNCLASLSNERIAQGEVLDYQLRELGSLTAESMRGPRALKGARSGALVGLFMILSLSIPLTVIGVLVGAAVGWLVGWRHWGQTRSCLVYFASMAGPVVAMAPLWPFGMLDAALTGMFIGIVVQLSD